MAKRFFAASLKEFNSASVRPKNFQCPLSSPKCFKSSHLLWLEVAPGFLAKLGTL